MSRHSDPHKRAEEPESGQGIEGQADESVGDRSAAEEREFRRETDKIARFEAELEDLRQTLIRRQADFENYRKRIDRERREERDRAVAQLAESLLPVLDNFERALAAHQDPAYEEYRRGFAMIYRQLAEMLAQHGIARMEDPTGRPFDPLLHHAVERVETGEYPEGTVIGEAQAGYKFRDRVLRPAQVRVAVAAAGRAAFPPEIN